jgi:uncharacterized protein (TIGR02246 family)
MIMTMFQILAVFAVSLLITGTEGPGTKPDKRDGISQTTELFTGAWNRSDSQAMSETFLQDGSLVIPQGVMIESRAAIESFYRNAFARGYQGSHATSAIKRVTRLRDDIALIDGEWSIDGAHDAEGNKRSEERGIFFAIVVRRDGKWLIAALREQSSAAELQIPETSFKK